MPVFTRRTEALTRILLDHLASAFAELSDIHYVTIQELGYSAQDRLQLSSLMAQSLLAQGFGPFTSDQVQALFREGDLQTLLYLLLCGSSTDQFQQIGLSKLLQRSGFPRELEKLAQALPEVFPYDDTDPVSEVPAMDGATTATLRGYFFLRPRSRRTTGRVGEQYSRRVPESDLPS